MYTMMPFKKLLSILCWNALLSERDMNITACHKSLMSSAGWKFAYESCKILAVHNVVFCAMSAVMKGYKALI